MIAISIISLILMLFVIYEINTFITLKNKLKQSKSTIEVYLNQRFDLIPNLVEIVKAYAKFEESVYSNIAEMRQVYQQEKNKDLAKAANIHAESNKLFAVAENMPDLKSNEQFLNLQKSLEDIESNLQAARRLYNGDVTLYNTTIKIFPNNIFATIFKFKEEPLFEIEEYKKSNVQIDL